VTIADVENSLRVAASVWATANNIQFEFDNSVSASVSNPTTPILMWGFSEMSRDRISSAHVLVEGECRGTILIPVTPDDGTSQPVKEHIELVESLLDNFRGKTDSNDTFSLSESRLEYGSNIGSMRAITAVIEWQWTDNRYVSGSVTAPLATKGVDKAYEILRSVWGSRVQSTISTNTFFDGTPGLAIALPACICSFSVLKGRSLEMNSTKSTGQVNVDLHYPLGTGVTSMQLDTELIIQSFDSIEGGGVVFETPQVSRIGRTTEETWHVNVRMPFTFQDIS